MGNPEPDPVKALQAVLEHRPIILFKDIAPDLDCQIRPYAEEKTIKRRMVQLTECDAIAYHRFPTRLTVRDDVGSIEELGVPK
jgi:hypothetical protein